MFYNNSYLCLQIVAMKYFKTILILAIPLVLILGYAVVPYELAFDKYGIQLQKINIDHVPILVSLREYFWPSPKDTIPLAPIVEEPAEQETALDTTSHRILFFGDSMLEGLGPRMCDYAMQNNHELHTVCWYSSSTKTWAETDTLEFFVNKIQPDFIMICIGSNEQFVKDIDLCRTYIRTIQRKLGNLPAVWICPPEWKKERPFNSMLQEEVGQKNFFDSRTLTYNRKSDHAHPTRESASMWMDSIASWMQSDKVTHPIRMTAPTTRQKRHWQSIYLAPPTE